MKADAKKQLKKISLQEIKKIIERIEPDYYKKIVLEKDCLIQRSNYIYVKYEGVEFDRTEKKVEFPLFGAIVDDFSEFEGGVKRFKKDKIAIQSEQIFKHLREIYKIPPQHEDLSNVANWEVFPVNMTEEGLLADKQDKYFFPGLTSHTTGIAEFINGPVEGTFGKFVFVDNIILTHPMEKLWLWNGEELDQGIVSEIWHHCEKSVDLQLVYSDFVKFQPRAKKAKESYDEFSSELCKKLRSEFNIKKMQQERIYYQVIPCVQLNYKHVLTNTKHELTIINIFDEEKVQLIFHSAPEEAKNHLGNTAKKLTGFFSRMMKTKAYASKQDRKNEINLMIRLARIDGIIQDEEKIMLSEMIGGLKEFTHNEKQQFYDLMSSPVIPELAEDELSFNDDETKERVIANMEALARSDRKVVEKEKKFMERIIKILNKPIEG